MPPKLLVSVRTPQEAYLAASENVEIIDIKEPKFGSLGMSEISNIQKCVQTVREISPQSWSSVACGEVSDWLNNSPLQKCAFSNVHYLKMGLSKLADTESWREKWILARQTVESSLQIRDKSHWIAVAYVDVAAAESPSIQEIIAAAVDTDCRGVLFDTFEKNNLRFSDWISDSQLIEYLETIHAAGMFCSVAGKLNEVDIERLAAMPVDVLAVRSAVCEEGVRTAAVSRRKIRDLQSIIRNCDQRSME